MRDAGAAEEAPFFRRNGALVADGECAKDSRGRCGTENCLKAIAHRFPGLFNPVQEGVALAQPLLLAALAHVTGGADASLEQPPLVIETVGIEVAVRPSQAH